MTTDTLPDDIGALGALILAERAEGVQVAHIVRSSSAHFGCKSEHITDD